MDEQRLEFRGKEKLPVVQCGVVEGLLAEAIPREKKRLFRLVPDREGIHALEVGNAVFSPFLPGMHDDLGIAARAEPVSPGFELIEQFDEVVDLTVEGDTDGAILIEKRLVSQRREIDDGQPAVSEADTWRRVIAVIIGPAVLERFRHLRQQPPIDRLLAPRVEYASDAAHVNP